MRKKPHKPDCTAVLAAEKAYSDARQAWKFGDRESLKALKNAAKKLYQAVADVPEP